MSHIMDAVSFLKGTPCKVCHRSFIPAAVTVWRLEELHTSLRTPVHTSVVSTAATKVPDVVMGTCVPGSIRTEHTYPGPSTSHVCIRATPPELFLDDAK